MIVKRLLALAPTATSDPDNSLNLLGTSLLSAAGLLSGLSSRYDMSGPPNPVTCWVVLERSNGGAVV
ncbi:unnamed protein product [Heligmosomoides polygyrus]|uniref:Secreted protein n=1 Tax=Heligmosomoides polygyrus TaxID=6339 RepID=A0A183FNL3_HELPZ|nr:unnamed protein product [Heligmosomoides polygyrus]